MKKFNQTMQKFFLTFSLIAVCFQLNAALITWDTANAVDGDWGNSANWVGGVVPGASDEVVISGSAAMVIISTTVTVLSIEIKSSAELTINAVGILNLGSEDGGSTNGALDLDSSGGKITNDGIINVTSATDNGIHIKGEFINNGTITIDGAGGDGINATAGGDFTNTANGIINISGTGDDGLSVVGGTTGGVFTASNFVNNGTISIGTYGDEGIYIEGGSTVKNNLTITVAAGGDFGIVVKNNSSFDNCGDLNVCDSTDDSVRVETGGSFSNSSTLLIKNSGDHGIELFGSFDNSGTLKITNSTDDGIKVESNSSGGAVGPGAFTNSGTLVIDGFGADSDAIDTETVNGGSFSAGGTFDIGCDNLITKYKIRCDMDLANTVNFDVIGADSKGSQGGQGISYDWIDNVGSTGDCTNGSSPTLDVTGAVAQFNLGTGYVPEADDCFTIVDGSGLANGPFSDVIFTPALPVGLTWADCTTDNTEIEICIVAVVLPVELVNFIGEKSARGAQLSWITASEEGNEGFEIERSSNSKEWTKIGDVRGNGNSNTSLRYAYLDKTPTNGTNYYRLKQNDFDGQFEYSKTIALDFRDGKSELIAYPNPVKDVLNIDIDQDLENLDIQLIDTNGKIVWRNKGWIQTIPLNDISSGVYLLSVESSGFQSTKMIIKE